MSDQPPPATVMQDAQPRTDASWAQDRFEPVDVLGRFQEQLPVSLIATTRAELKTCFEDEEVGKVVEQNEAGFDYLPVVQANGTTPAHIVGLFHTKSDTTGSARTVRAVMSPLSENNLIGADASIVDFVRGADKAPCRLVIAGAKITGLVSISDLQRLPVRAALFAMVTHFEMAMADAIRREATTFDIWIKRLSDDRATKIQDLIDRSRTDDGFVDELLMTQFADKRTILSKSPTWPWHRKTFELDVKRIEALRNNLAHSNNYASTPSDARTLCATVRDIDAWVDRLMRWQVSAQNEDVQTATGKK